jgi:hypothetical protein
LSGALDERRDRRHDRHGVERRSDARRVSPIVRCPATRPAPRARSYVNSCSPWRSSRGSSPAAEDGRRFKRSSRRRSPESRPSQPPGTHGSEGRAASHVGTTPRPSAGRRANPATAQCAAQLTHAGGSLTEIIGAFILRRGNREVAVALLDRFLAKIYKAADQKTVACYQGRLHKC